MKKIFSGVPLLVAMMVSALIVTAAPASADAGNGLHACRSVWQATGTYQVQPHPTDPSQNLYYYAAAKYTVPSSSTCNDINVSLIHRQSAPYEAGCTNIRVRFFPSGGGEWTNGWRWLCDSASWRVIASAVTNGTLYRIEVMQGVGIPPIPFDVRVHD